MQDDIVPKRQLMLVGIAVFLTGILLIVKPTYSIYQVNKTINIMDAKVGNFGGCKTLSVVAGDITVDYCQNMIPVAYDSSGQTVKADKTNTDSAYYWFDYCQKTSGGLYGYKASGCTFRWANVVLVSDTNRSTYKSASPGTLIPESEILAYLVYVPRYKYELFNANDGITPEQTINIVFENKTTTPSCGGNTCTQNRIYSTGTNGQFLTHPAFTFGTTELNGLWVGKFETSVESDISNIYDTAFIQIKPNKDSDTSGLWSSWNYVLVPVAQMFTFSQYFKSSQFYGITDSTIDAHMMKNMEWGATAYLSQSIYGKRGNQGTEVWINNYWTSSYSTLTGCSGTSADASSVTSCTYPFPNANGVEASTTGSLYGIYDMSGGNWEYVMGNMVANGQSAPGPISSSESGFDGSTYPYPASKYYDSFNYGDSYFSYTDYTRGYLGDATKEVVSKTSFSGYYGNLWNQNSGEFVADVFVPYSWFTRGECAECVYQDAKAGIFAFSPWDGYSYGLSFRLTLTFE